MKKIVILIISFLLYCAGASITAQSRISSPPGLQRAYVDHGDTIILVQLRNVYIYPPYKFRSDKEEKQYWKMVRDVKKTLPLAKIVYATLIETYEFIETLPTEESRKKHLKRMENELFEEYKPILKKLTYSQGRLLIKLIDRECNQSSFNLIKAFLGGFRAGFWQTFGALFGVSLKAEWDPQGKDAMLERICVMVENGML